MIRFIFGIHNHQPVGNFDGVFQYAYEKCYYPFLETISNHPSIKFSIHTSGPLYQWIEQNQPEWFEMLKKMVNRGRRRSWGADFTRRY
jgi:alpha-amylase